MTVRRVCLVGASGLVGSAVMAAAVGRDDLRLIAVARGEVPLPAGAHMEVLVGAPERWGELIEAARADVLVCALGTTIARAGSEKAFRAVDHDLVLATARAARACGIAHFVLVSSVGADSASRNFYLSVKGETEVALMKLGFERLDVVRPGLLLGKRAEKRKLEGLGQILGPLANLAVLHGKARRFRSVRATRLGRALLGLALENAKGRFVHEYDGIRRAQRRFGE